MSLCVSIITICKCVCVFVSINSFMQVSICDRITVCVWCLCVLNIIFESFCLFVLTSTKKLLNQLEWDPYLLNIWYISSLRVYGCVSVALIHPFAHLFCTHDTVYVALYVCVSVFVQQIDYINIVWWNIFKDIYKIVKKKGRFGEKLLSIFKYEM